MFLHLPHSVHTSSSLRRAKSPDEVRLKGPAFVKATIEIYNTIRAELLPTPAKSHYTYNMRDLSKVFLVGGRVTDQKHQF